MAPTKARGIVALDETRLPAAIVLDTSAVIEFVLPSQTAHQQWRRFLMTCGRQGTLLVSNQLMEIELYDVLFNIALIERWGKGAAHGPKRCRVGGGGGDEPLPPPALPNRSCSFPASGSHWT